MENDSSKFVTTPSSRQTSAVTESTRITDDHRVISSCQSDNAYKIGDSNQQYPENKSILMRHPRFRIIENFIIVWLDSNINGSNEDITNSITQLRCIFNSIETFTDADECVDFVTDIDDEKIFMIISSSSAQQLVSLIEEFSQLASIYIFCDDTSKHEEWANEFRKVKGVFTQIESICDILKRDVRQSESDFTPISIVKSTSITNIDELDQSFMYSQLAKEILLDIEYDKKAKKEFTDFCSDQYTGTDVQLNIINEFEQDYELHSPIWWYTKETFVYSMLNKALRTQDTDIILKMGFFVNDLHRQIKQLHSENHETGKMIIYRGQGMSHVDFEKLKESKGGLLSFNNFLSTSTDSAVASQYADSARYNPDLTGILFRMEIDPSITSIPFTSLDNISYFSDAEKEILFSMHTVFRIDRIDPMEDRLWKVELTLTTDNDQQLKDLTDYIRIQLGGETGRHRMVNLLYRMGEFEKATEFYNILLETISNGHPEESATSLATTYNIGGLVHDAIGDYATALSFYEKTLEIRQKSLPLDHPDLFTPFNNIATMYDRMGKYSTALAYYEKALDIQQKSLLLDSPCLAIIYNNIGRVHDSMGDYSAALSYFEKSLEIKQKSLPLNHPGLANIYNDIGNVYHSMGDYSTSLLYYEKTLKIQQKSRPPNHPCLATIYNNIAALQDKMGDYSTSLFYYEKALEIQQKSLSPNHPHLATIYNNIGKIHYSLGDYSAAVSHFENSLEIRQKVLPLDHPDLVTSYSNIAAVYKRMEDYSTALSYYKKSLEIQQKSLPPNHPGLAIIYNNVGRVHHSIGDYAAALSFYEKALEIQQKSLPLNHPSLTSTYKNMANVHDSMENHSTALLYYEKLLEIQQKQ